MTDGRYRLGYEFSYPRLPKELRNTDPENMAFLSVMWDFGVTAITRNCMYIRTAVFEYIKNHGFLDTTEDEMLGAVAEICSEDINTVKSGLKFTLEILWERCDEKRLVAKHFPYEPYKKLPHYTDVMELMRFISDIVSREYLYLRGSRG